MDKKSRGHDYVSLENGDCLSKMPAATAEQLNIAKVLSRPGDDVDLRQYVAQLQELTKCTEDQAVTALYDCENNLERAVELLLDKFRCGIEEEWHTTGRKPRTKHTPNNEAEDHAPDAANSSERSKKTSKKDADANEMLVNGELSGSSLIDAKGADSDSSPHKDVRGRKSNSENAENDRRADRLARPRGGARISTANSTRDHRTRTSANSESDGWDPYTEYGEWGGESIEVVNSNASIARGFQEEAALPEELFIDIDNTNKKASSDEPSAITPVPVPETQPSPQLLSSIKKDSLFLKQAQSKPPPPAFTHFPDICVFIVPKALPQVSSQLRFKFAGELHPPLLHPAKMSGLHHDHPAAQLNEMAQTNGHKGGSSEISEDYTQYNTSSPPKSPAAVYDLNKTPVGSNLIESSNEAGDKTEAGNTSFSGNHFQAPVTQKSATSFANAQKQQSDSNYPSGTSGSQQGYLDQSFKNYILDALPGEMNKLSVAESSSQSAKPAQFNLQSPAQGQQPINTGFTHAQGNAGNAMQPQMSKMPLSHISTHAPVHPTQQAIASRTPQSHQQPAATMPPGMPHFINQFATPAYHMFNLPGNSSNPTPLIDLDQLQLLQQHQRILYDIQLQQQAATTAQSLLTSTADGSSTSHVTAPNAGIRPDMLAQLGHAPPMMTPGHPYFPYPGFVLMNGYNAFFNQQQQAQASQDGSQAQGSGHCGSPITQHQPQPTNSVPSYSSLKGVNTSVNAYEDLLDLKYDPAKQVGFKNNSNQPSYESFQGQVSTENVGSKLSSTTHSAGAVMTQGYSTGAGNTHPHFSPQFYPPAAPYLTAAAVAAAAVAAASAQQQQVSNSGGGPSAGNSSQSNTGNSTGSSGVGAQPQGGSGAANQMHLSGSAGQAMVLGPTGTAGMHHHQRSAMSHQH
ncbi:unnamed protein product [Calicophoron daubneyi]|uniref:UBA-like domain-containing protein n=1 Tax=Calicophoron daubneyi TaxID=300641 RepID=A0AAV2TCH8_CALDB